MNKYHNDRRPEVVAFLKDLADVCKKHGMSLGHEDSHGGFLVEPWDEYNEEWMLDAAEVVPDKPKLISDEAITLLRMLDRTDERFPMWEDMVQPDHVAELRTHRLIKYIFGVDMRWIAISDAGREYLRNHA